MLDVFRDPRRDWKRMSAHRLHVVTRCELPSVARKCCSSQVSSGVAHTLLVEDETSNAFVFVWVGNDARCVSRDVTLHRLSACS